MQTLIVCLISLIFSTAAFAQNAIVESSLSRDLVKELEAFFEPNCGDRCEIEFSSLNCALFPNQGLACSVYFPKSGKISTKYGETLKSLHMVLKKVTDKYCSTSLCVKGTISGTCKKEYKGFLSTSYECVLVASKNPSTVLTSEHFD
ncbi:MAG: hypothetical protein AB7O96_01950 [Pseudobdellovibrionaceae bacterium]